MVENARSTAALKTMERDVAPAVLDTLKKISKKNKKLRNLQDKGLAYPRRCVDAGTQEERRYERHRRKLVGLLGAIHLNGRRVDQLAAQLYDFDRRSALGDITAVAAESRTLPDEIRRVAFSVREGESEADRAIDDFMSYSTTLDRSWNYYRIGDDCLDTVEVGKAALRDVIDEFQYWRGPRAAAFATRQVYMAVAHCLTDALLLADVPRGAKLRDERALRRFPGLGTSAVLPHTGTRFRIKCIQAKALRMLGYRACVKAKRAHFANGGFAEEIVAGRMKMRIALCESPLTWDAVTCWHGCLMRGTMRLADIIDLRATRDANRHGLGASSGDNR